MRSENERIENPAVTTVNVYYPRYTAMGRRLRANHESERHFIAKEILKAFSLPFDTYVAFTGI